MVYVVRNNIVPFTTSALALSVVQKVMNYFKPQNVIKSYALNLYDSVLNIPVGGHIRVTWVTLPVKYLVWLFAVLSAYKSYPYLLENGGHNYLNFSRSDLSFPERYSFSEFLKYRLVNEHSSYVMLDKQCKEGDQKISELAAGIFRGPGMSEHKAEIYLCRFELTDT